MRLSQKKAILGLGLDNAEGHSRYTKGPNFHLLGGSEETHERMQETAMKFNEKLKEREKTIDDISSREFFDIIDEVA